MKKVFIIAAVLIAALPMAHATTYWFTGSGPGVTSSPTTTYSGVTLAGYTFPSGTLGGGAGHPHSPAHNRVWSMTATARV